MDSAIAITTGSIPVHINRKLGSSSYLCDWDISDIDRLVALLNKHGLRYLDNGVAYSRFVAGEFVMAPHGGSFHIFAGSGES